MQPLVLQRILFKRNGALWETLPMFEYSIASTSWLLGITMTMNQTANCLIRVYSLGFKKLAIFTRKQTNLLPSCLPRHSYPPSAVQMAASRPWVVSGEKNTNPSVWESRCINALTASKAPKTSDRHVAVAQESTNTSPLPQCQRITPYSNLLLVHCPAAGALPGGCQLQSNSVVEDITFRGFRKWQLIWYHDTGNIWIQRLKGYSVTLAILYVRSGLDCRQIQ